MVTLGIDVLMDSVLPWQKGERVGLLCNQASVNRELIHSRDLLTRLIGDNLSCLFSPQHGFYGEKQDNMIESGHYRDEVTGLPVFSLYAERRKPTRKMLDELDVMVIDIADVGTRVYTFLYTMAYCLEGAAAHSKKVVVLDRPNPIGGLQIEGNLLKSEYASFVGMFSLPMRHGLTFGELARYINEEYHLGAELTVIPMKGWKRSMHYRETGLPWVFPSPNMPTPETALVYPGQVIWEGTTVSEGRGTTLPFELVGAPYWKHASILERLKDYDLPGCQFRPIVFEPTSGKHHGEPCVGFQLHVTDQDRFRPYRTSLALYQVVYQLFAAEFQYKHPPYEYEYEKLPMDLILGDAEVREQVEQGDSLLEMERSWQDDLELFERSRRDYFMY